MCIVYITFRSNNKSAHDSEGDAKEITLYVAPTPIRKKKTIF